METTEWNPGTILETSGSYWRACALHAGVKLDLFTAIGDKTVDAQKIAKKTGVAKRGLEMLLNALSAMNLLNKSSEGYKNTQAGKSFLSKDSERYIGFMILHHHHLVVSWANIHEAIKTDGPIRIPASYKDEETREAFLMGMFNIGMSIAPDVAKIIDLSGKTRLLDLGGGPGTYAIHFCMENPNLSADVFDLPHTKQFAKKVINRFGMNERVNFLPGNYLEDPIEGTYDVLWLSHILHAEGKKDCEAIIKKAVSALLPGGVILIHDFILENTKDAPLFPALFSLNMLLGTKEGRSYAEVEIIEMLEKSGVTEIYRIPFQGPTDSGILSGILR